MEGVKKKNSRRRIDRRKWNRRELQRFLVVSLQSSNARVFCLSLYTHICIRIRESSSQVAENDGEKVWQQQRRNLALQVEKKKGRLTAADLRILRPGLATGAEALIAAGPLEQEEEEARIGGGGT